MIASKMKVEDIEKMHETAPSNYKDDLKLQTQMMMQHPAYGNA